MSDQPYDGQSRNFGSTYVKQDMILSDEEEESATLAEPMTVECAKQLAQSSTSSASITHILPAVSHSPLVASTSIHSINSLSHVRPAILHTLVSSSNVNATLHGVTNDSSHLVPPTITPIHNHNMWSTPSTVEDCNEIDNYPSTVDIDAIRDSPSPDPFSEKLVTINENWNCLEEHSEENAADGDDEDGSDDDDTDSSDSDSSLASSSSIHATPKKLQKDEFQNDCKPSVYEYKRGASRSHSESANSKSESDSKEESDNDSSDGSSSDEESSASSMDCESNEYINNSSPQCLKPQVTIVTPEVKLAPAKSTCTPEQQKSLSVEKSIKKPEPPLTKTVPMVPDYASPNVHPRPYVKPNVHSLISTDSKRQQRLEQAKTSARISNAMEKTSSHIEHVPINSNNHVNITNSKKSCNNMKNLKNAESFPCHKNPKSELYNFKEMESSLKSETKLGKTYLKEEANFDLKSKSHINSKFTTQLEEKRMEKKLEMDREFDRLLKSTRHEENCDTKLVQKSCVKKCIVNKGKKCDEIKGNDIPKQVNKSQLHSRPLSALPCEKKNNDRFSLIKSKCKNEPKKLAATSSNCKQLNLKSCPNHSSESPASSLSSDSDDVALLKTRKRLPSLIATATTIQDSKSRKLTDKTKPPALNEITPKVSVCKSKRKNKAEPSQNPPIESDIRPTIADTVKIKGRRRSFDKDPSSSEDKRSDTGKSHCESSSSESEEILNEKVDLDTEQTQTFSVSEKNFNHGRLTEKIAAMKMAKFGKKGLREVNKLGLPTRSQFGDTVIARRPRLLQLRGGHLSGSVPLTEKHKVKTAAERKTYVDVLPATGGDILQKKQVAKTVMRVPASSLYRSGSYGTSLISSQAGSTSDDEDHISRIAHHLSQISHENITDGLQILDQDDLAAILPDVAPATAADSSASSFDPFMEGHDQSSDLSDREISSPMRSMNGSISADVRNRSNSLSFGASTSLHLNKTGKNNNEYACKQNIKSNVKRETLAQINRKSNINIIVQKDFREDETEHNIVLPELESFMPMDCNASNVSPDSGIQSVNGSPLHHVGSPSHSPFYSSNIVSLSGSSISTAYQPGSVGTNEEGIGATSSRSYSPNSSPQNYPSPPTLLPAITPPHMTSSPRYCDGSPNSPQMPSLKCQVYPPPWEMTSREGAASGSESGKESNIPKRSRGRPKGSKSKKKDCESCCLNDKIQKGNSFKDLLDLGQKESNKEIASNFVCSPLKNKWRSSVDPYDLPAQDSSHPWKRGPGRPKKKQISVESAAPKQVNAKGRCKKSSHHISDKLMQAKRPVGRPRKNPKTKLKLNCTAAPVTLASRKSFSEKIMHKIINDKVRNSEKSDKLEEISHPADIDKGSSINQRKNQNRQKRQTSDGIPLIEDKKKKRGRRKELPAIFEKVYGCMKNVNQKTDKTKFTSPAVLFKRKKKKKKSFKTKHKNIVDPVFLEEVEKLVGEFEKCQISKTCIVPLAKTGEVLLPSIFRFKKVVLSSSKKRRVIDKSKVSDKESGTEGESKEKLSGKRKKKLQETTKQGRERLEVNEQRLPLKKRHRHISTAVPIWSDMSKLEPSSPSAIKLCNEAKDKSSASKSPLRGEPVKVAKNDGKAIKSFENATCVTNKRRLANVEKCFSGEDMSIKMLDQVVSVEIVKEVAETSHEVFRKHDSSQSMVATTPKKRHRLAADLIAIGMTTIPVTCTSTEVVHSETPNIPTSNSVISKRICQTTQLTIKEESESCSKLNISNGLIADKTESSLSEEQSSNPPMQNSNELCANEQSSAANVDLSSTHSDSDIPSEHEPLCESDQSGFMSDKETTKEDDFKQVQKKFKKKRDLRPPKSDPVPCKEEQTLVKSESPIHRKKVKRRKTNKTGFPTVKKKKKKPKIEQNQATEVLKSPDKKDANNIVNKISCNLEAKVCVKQLIISETMDGLVDKNEGVIKSNTKPRGRPRKDQTCLHKITPTTSQVVESKKPEDKANDPIKVDSVQPNHRLRKAVSTFRNCKKRDLSLDSLYTSDNKRQRRMAEDEVEDSDVFLPSEYQPSSEPVSSDESGRSTLKQKAPRWRRKYLIAGLFSDYYKQDEPRRNGDLNGGKSKCSQEAEPRTHSLLPAPLYCKKKLRETQKHFLLPYDLWWLHKYNVLPGRDIIASWNYKKVKSNVYYDVKSTFELDVQSCNCKKPSKPKEKGCEEDCINRMMFIECSPQHCPVKDICSNQQLQRHENLSCLKKFMTEDKGWGIKATMQIKQSGFIMEYVGEVVSEREFRHRMQTRYSNDKHHYCLNLDRGMMIDGHRIGSDCRFVNHSCDPNCEMQKWNVNGQYRMALFALKDVDVDEELTYDYNFHLFNPARGQECKCKTNICRGVIGGRSQRLNGQPVEERKKTNGRNKKDCRKRKRGASTDTESSLIARNHFMPIKPLSHQQRVFILAHRSFLVRNLEKIRKSRDRLVRYHEKKLEEESYLAEEPCSKIQRFMTHFTALNTARSVKTRRLAQAEDDPEMTRIAKLAQIFKDIYDKLVASRDESEKPLATPFMNLFSKKKYPTYYIRVGEPIDLCIIEKNILTGHYTTVEGYDRDLMKLFSNNLRYFGRNTEVGKMAVGLRKVYSECKLQFKPLLEEVLGEDHLPTAFADCPVNEEFEDEDVIRCVCNLPRDEGTMIQCEKCLVWQHCDCMGVEDAAFPEHYLCEECNPRLVSPEVPMTPQPPDSNNKKHFVTLLRDMLQVKQGDSVYILRDRPKQKAGERRQPAYKLAKDIKYHELLIFKVESLFIDDKGDKYAFGHHFLRPHETFHEPWRKFFPNEVIRSPFCEILALDMIIRHCWVMDLNSYCRGKPIGATDEHIYVCEYRVDKSARVFSKISKPKYLICKKAYAFIQYPEKLRPMRTYTPHEVIMSNKKSKPPSAPVEQNAAAVSTTKEAPLNKTQIVILSESSSRSNSGTRKPRSNNSSRERNSNEEKSSQQPVPNTRAKKRDRVNKYATQLLKLLPSKGAVDLGYLLETGKRNRKKTAAFSS